MKKLPLGFLLCCLVGLPLVICVSSPEVPSAADGQRKPSTRLPPQSNSIPQIQDSGSDYSKPTYFSPYQGVIGQSPATSSSLTPLRLISQPPTLQPPGQNQQPNYYSMAALSAQQGPPTPVIMQYLPQGQMTGGVQYLQLIPTRPLIVPISPYITQLAAQQQPIYRGPTQHPSAVSDQAARTVITGAPGSAQPFPTYAPASPVLLPSSSIPTFAFIKPNNGIELVNGPQDLRLNTREYFPGQGDSIAARVQRSRF